MQYITTSQAAEKLNVTKRYIAKLCVDNQIDGAYKKGSRWQIPLESILKLADKEKIEIKSLKRGECLMFVAENHILAKIECSDIEKQIIE